MDKNIKLNEPILNDNDIVECKKLYVIDTDGFLHVSCCDINGTVKEYKEKLIKEDRLPQNIKIRKCDIDGRRIWHLKYF